MKGPFTTIVQQCFEWWIELQQRPKKTNFPINLGFIKRQLSYSLMVGNINIKRENRSIAPVQNSICYRSKSLKLTQKRKSC